MSDSEIEISALEVYSMIIARDNLVEQLLTVLAGPALATIWRTSTAEIDSQIRNGLVDQIKDLDG